MYSPYQLVATVLLLLMAEGYNASFSEECVHHNCETGSCIEMGFRTNGDTLLYEGTKQKYGIPLVRRTDTLDVKTGEEGNPGKNPYFWDRISYIQVRNLMQPGQGGDVTVTAGGVGESSVSFEFKSLRGEGYHFHIRIYGNRPVRLRHQLYQQGLVG